MPEEVDELDHVGRTHIARCLAVHDDAVRGRRSNRQVHVVQREVHGRLIVLAWHRAAAGAQ